MNKSIKANYEPSGYDEFSYMRSQYGDYLTVSWNNNSQFFEDLGWDYDFYNLSKSCFYIDERFNTEDLKEISEKTAAFSDKIMTVKEKIYCGYNAMFGNGVSMALTLSTLIPIAFILWMFVISKEKKKKIFLLLFAIFALGGFLLLCFYLCFIVQRFRMHVYQTVAIPAITTLIIIASEMWSAEFKNQFNKSKKKIVSIVASVILICLSLTAVAGMTYDSYFVEHPQYNDGFIKSLEEYTAKSPENFYVYDRVEDDLRFSITFDQKSKAKVNYMRWGGCYLHTRLNEDLLRINGYENGFLSKNLYDESVYLILDITTLEEKLSTLQSYFNHNFGETEIVEVYRNDYFVVFDVNYAS